MPFIRSGHWWVRMFDFPHVQITVMTTISLVLSFLFLDWEFQGKVILIPLLLTALTYQFFILFPYTPLVSNQVIVSENPNSENIISLLSSNVLISNRDPQRLKNVIARENPDVIVLLEADDWWTEQVQYLKSEYPYFHEQPQGDGYGMLLYSKKKLENIQIHYLQKDNIPSITTKVKLDSGKLVDLFCVHPEPPAPQEADKSDHRDAELLTISKKLVDKQQPTIVIGDLNDVAWSKTTRLFQKISGLLDPRIGRGTFNTFHADYFFFRWPLDHVFHSNHFQLVEIKRLPHIGSDHFPIYASLEYKKEATQKQDRPQAHAMEKEKAEKIILKVQGTE